MIDWLHVRANHHPRGVLVDDPAPRQVSSGLMEGSCCPGHLSHQSEKSISARPVLFSWPVTHSRMRSRSSFTVSGLEKSMTRSPPYFTVRTGRNTSAG